MDLQDLLSPVVLLVLLGLGWGGFLALLLMARGALAAARARGGAEREPEVVALARERDAQQDRAEDLAERLQAAESDRDAWRERADELSDRCAALGVQAERTERLDERLAQLEQELRAAIVARGQAETRTGELRARLEEQGQAAQQRMQEFDQRLKAELAQLTQGLLDERTRQFDERSEKQIGGLLRPMREELAKFVETVQRTNVEILSLKQLNQQITEEAANLARALKGDTQAQGAWGEMVLERVLEMSGLQAGRGYDLQVSLKGEDGGRPRPDVIVHLPDARDLVIDAKVSLVAWDRALSCAEAEPREQAMKEHLASLRRHIEELSKRDYTSIPGLRTLDFVLLFVPVEAAFIEALRRDDALYAFALERNIALVSPSTLLATLRTVAHLWKMEDRNVNAQEIARQAGALHDKFVLLEADFNEVGELLGRTQRVHHEAMRRISEGPGNLMRRVDQLRKLGADAKKKLAEERFESAEDEPAAVPTIEPPTDSGAAGDPPD